MNRKANYHSVTNAFMTPPLFHGAQIMYILSWIRCYTFSSLRLLCLLWREGTSTKSCCEVAGAWRSIFILSIFTGLLHISTYNGGTSAIPPLKGTNQRSRVFQVALVRRLLILESFLFSTILFFQFLKWKETANLSS